MKTSILGFLGFMLVLSSRTAVAINLNDLDKQDEMILRKQLEPSISDDFYYQNLKGLFADLGYNGVALSEFKFKAERAMDMFYNYEKPLECSRALGRKIDELNCVALEVQWSRGFKSGPNHTFNLVLVGYVAIDMSIKKILGYKSDELRIVCLDDECNYPESLTLRPELPL